MSNALPSNNFVSKKDFTHTHTHTHIYSNIYSISFKMLAQGFALDQDGGTRTAYTPTRNNLRGRRNISNSFQILDISQCREMIRI